VPERLDKIDRALSKEDKWHQVLSALLRVQSCLEQRQKILKGRCQAGSKPHLRDAQAIVAVLQWAAGGGWWRSLPWL